MSTQPADTLASVEPEPTFSTKAADCLATVQPELTRSKHPADCLDSVQRTIMNIVEQVNFWQDKDTLIL